MIEQRFSRKHRVHRMTFIAITLDKCRTTETYVY